MKNKKQIKSFIFTLILSVSVHCLAQQQKEVLKVYLPREINLEDNHPTLGKVGILRGSETLIDKAGDIGLGRLATPKQTIIVNRNMILSRLACNGIPASCVTLTGSEETVIKREHQVIAGDNLVKEAVAFLKKNLPDPSICQIDATKTPNDLILPNISENIRFVCQLGHKRLRNQQHVLISVFQDDLEVGQNKVTFQFKFKTRKAIAKTTIAEGDPINTQNITIEQRISNYPEPANWNAPYGLIATRTIPANTIISNSMVDTPKPKVVLKRNQSVAIKIDRAGLVATAIGKALQDGTVGEFIKVKNIDSQKIIMAKVKRDGTVEPVF